MSEQISVISFEPVILYVVVFATFFASLISIYLGFKNVNSLSIMGKILLIISILMLAALYWYDWILFDWIDYGVYDEMENSKETWALNQPSIFLDRHIWFLYTSIIFSNLALKFKK